MNLVYSITTQSENRKFPVGYTTAYRFGFNGKENDDETYGAGNVIAFEARIYDSRLGRFLSIDPLVAKYPFWSPYCFAGNSPITLIDCRGMGPDDPKHGSTRTTTDGCKEYWDSFVDGTSGNKGAWVDYRPETFSEEQIVKLKEYFTDNATLQRYHLKYDDCITAANNGIDMLQERPKGTLNTKTAKYNKKTGKYETAVHYTGSYLMKNNLATEYKEISVDAILARDKNGNPKIDDNTASGYSYNITIWGSVTQTALQMTDKRDGYHVFLLGVMGGLHSMTLIINIVNGSPQYILSDQVYGYTQGWYENSEEDINSKISRIMYYNFPGGNYGYDANQLWQIKQQKDETYKNFNDIIDFISAVE